jgi:hypothetical protein
MSKRGKMRVVKKSLEYAGVTDPTSPSEMEIEIYGLKNVIRQAQELISRHEQAIALARLMLMENAHAAVQAGNGGIAEGEDHISSTENSEK